MRLGRLQRMLACGLGAVGALVSPIAASSGDSGAPEEPLLPFSTYLGGSGTDSPGGVAIGPDGVIWVAATTSSDDFPGAPRSVPWTEYPSDVVVLRIDPATCTVLSTLRLGGSSHEGVAGLVVDPAGNAYVAGRTYSADFPLTGGQLAVGSDGSPQGSFVACIRPDGSGVAWVYAFGGSGWYEYIGDIALTTDGDPVVVGVTSSADFPVVSPLDATYGGDSGTTHDGFVVRLRADGSGPVFSTYLGGEEDDGAFTVCIASDGGILVTGQTSSAEFISEAAPIVGASSGPPYYSSFLAELEPSGASLRRVARFGVSVGAMTSTPDGLVVVGRAGADSGLPFPPRSPDVRDDYFLLRLDAVSWAPSGGTFLGPKDGMGVDAVSVGGDGTVWVAGGAVSYAGSSASPAVPGAVRPHLGSPLDAYIAAFDPADDSQTFGTYLGGREQDYATGVAVAGDGSAWILGSTASTNFPVARPVQSAMASTDRYGTNLFIARVLAGDPSSRPVAIVDLLATPLDPYSVRVSWTPGDGTATAYGIDRSEGRDTERLESWTRVALVWGDAREWVDTGLRADRAYHYSVQAVNPAGGSPSSEPVGATTPPTIDFSIRRGIANYEWSRRHAPHRGDALKLRGRVLPSGPVGAPLDLPRDGLRLIGYDIDSGWELFAVPPGDPAWRVRRDGFLTWRRGTDRVRYDPATGDYELRFVRKDGLLLAPFTINEGFDDPRLVLVVGERTGSVAPIWRAIRRPGRNRWYGRAGSRTP